MYKATAKAAVPFQVHGVNGYGTKPIAEPVDIEVSVEDSDARFAAFLAYEAMDKHPVGAYADVVTITVEFLP